MKQKLFTISAIATAIFASPSFAQTGGTADQPAAEGNQTQGVRARQNPAAATSPDTSYHSITTDVPSNGRNTSQTGAAGTPVPGDPNSNAISGTPPAAVNGNAKSQTALPESMQIQRQTEQALPPPGDLIKKGGGPTTEAPPVVNFSVEQNRLDPAAPSRQRLQIDDLSGRRAQQQSPATPPPSAGVPARVTGSNGASTGASGSSVSGSPTVSSAVGGSSPSSSAGAGSSAGSSSSGGGH